MRDARPQLTGRGHRMSASSPGTSMYAALFAFQASCLSLRCFFVARKLGKASSHSVAGTMPQCVVNLRCDQPYFPAR